MLSIFLAYELPPEQKLHESIEFVLTFANPSLERGRLYSLSAEPLIFLEMGGLPHSLWSWRSTFCQSCRLFYTGFSLQLAYDHMDLCLLLCQGAAVCMYWFWRPQ